MASFLHFAFPLSLSLGQALRNDPLIQSTPSLLLALYLLELRHCDPENKYLRLLPKTFSTVLYYDWNTIQLLRHTLIYSNYQVSLIYSNISGRIEKLWLSIAKQFTYLERILGAIGKPIRDFNFASFLWAISVVMTRQNVIIDSKGNSNLALIPLWDMCNHKDGEVRKWMFELCLDPSQMTTMYDAQTCELEMFAMEDVPENGEILM